MKYRNSAGLCVSALILFATGFAAAAPVTVPTDLSPGDRYRIVFATSSRRDAGDDNIANYNAFVSAVAASQPELAALATTWRAIGSTAAVDARDNTDTNPTISTGAPIYNTVGSRIAADNSHLWDGAISDRIFDEEGDTPATLYVWTGTDESGIATPFPLGGRTSHPPIDDVSTGLWDTLSFWIESGDTFFHTDNRPLYGISGELVVVPEPSTLALALLGLAAMAACGRKRSNRATNRNRPT